MKSSASMIIEEGVPAFAKGGGGGGPSLWCHKRTGQHCWDAWEVLGHAHRPLCGTVRAPIRLPIRVAHACFPRRLSEFQRDVLEKLRKVV